MRTYVTAAGGLRSVNPREEVAEGHYRGTAYKGRSRAGRVGNGGGQLVSSRDAINPLSSDRPRSGVRSWRRRVRRTAITVTVRPCGNTNMRGASRNPDSSIPKAPRDVTNCSDRSLKGASTGPGGVLSGRQWLALRPSQAFGRAPERTADSTWAGTKSMTRRWR